MDRHSYGCDRWKLVCGCLEGTESRATEMLYAGVSAEVPYILVAETAEKLRDRSTASLLLVGTRESNFLLAQAVRAEEIPPEGYLVRVTASPFAPGRQIAIVAGSTPAQTIYAAAHFVGHYLPFARQRSDHMPYFRAVFSGPMPEYTAAEAPAFAERGIWTWGHCIYDYRRFAENMARLGLNAITLWNDFAPLNLREVVACFHSYGIKVILGYSWGWDEPVDISSDGELARWKKRAVEVYARDYEHAGGDGIYIQSFTETDAEEINGVPIAETVVKWVNTVGGAMLERWPGLQIQFGLHATSVRRRLPAIRGVDSRIHIFWEDCGAFPYAYLARAVESEKEMLAFTDEIVALRPGCGCGAVLKGQVCLDWDRFEHQKGPFLLGCESKKKIRARMEALRPQWHDVQSYWLENLGQCRRALQHLKGAAVYALVEDALLEEACWYPVALYAELLWRPDAPDAEVLRRVAQRTDVTMA